MAYFHFDSLQDEDITLLSKLDNLTWDLFEVDTYDLPLRTPTFEEKGSERLLFRKFQDLRTDCEPNVEPPTFNLKIFSRLEPQLASFQHKTFVLDVG